MKKAQIKMFENVGVLIVFFFLLILGVVFYFNYQEKSISLRFDEFLQARSFRTADIIFNLPEIACYYNDVKRPYCIDAQKTRAFTDYYKNNLDHYFPILGFSKISIDNEIIYENLPEKKSEVLVYSLPIVFYDPSKNNKCGDDLLIGECSLKNLKVEYYAN